VPSKVKLTSKKEIRSRLSYLYLLLPFALIRSKKFALM